MSLNKEKKEQKINNLHIDGWFQKQIIFISVTMISNIVVSSRSVLSEF